MSKHTTFAGIAKLLSIESKCVSMGVGAIIVNERNRIISSGVNGTASGASNCCDVHNTRGPEHSEWSSKYEIHAEMNAILELARSPISAKSITVYVTHSPCSDCLKHLIGLRDAGTLQVKDIIFEQQYYRTTDDELAEQKEYCKSLSVNLMSLEEALRHK